MLTDLPMKVKLSDRDQLTKSLARTEELIAAKLEMNHARQQVRADDS